MAMGYAAAGDFDAAFVSLERAFQVAFCGTDLPARRPGVYAVAGRSPIPATRAADRAPIGS